MFPKIFILWVRKMFSVLLVRIKKFSCKSCTQLVLKFFNICLLLKNILLDLLWNRGNDLAGCTHFSLKIFMYFLQLTVIKFEKQIKLILCKFITNNSNRFIFKIIMYVQVCVNNDIGSSIRDKQQMRTMKIQIIE